MLPYYVAGMSGGGAAAAGGLFEGLGTGLLSGGLSLGGSMMGASSSSKAMSKQLKWMSAMARKRHQLEVEDLRKAGINPILTATGGGGAATGTPSIQQENYGDLGASSFLAGKTTAKQLKLLDAQIAQAKANTLQTGYTAASAKSEAILTGIAAEREKRSFNAIDNSPAGQTVMPIGNKMPNWIKSIMTGVSGASGLLQQHAPNSAKEAIKHNVSPLQNVFDPRSAKQLWPFEQKAKPVKKQTNRERIGSAYDKVQEQLKQKGW